jgi:dipeptidyl aminopeptidase/acylaminoacyl peptidase
MTYAVDTRAEAPWKERWRAQLFVNVRLAEENRDRGVILSDPEGVIQVYAWDLRSGSLERRTDLPAGLRRAFLSPDGGSIYYHHDKAGNEIGHLYRVPWAGGEPEDVTPELPPYSMLWCESSVDNRYLALTRADKSGYHIDIRDREDGHGFVIDKPMLSAGPLFTRDNALCAILTTEPSMSTDFGLEVYEMTSGSKIVDLWDGEGTSMQFLSFSPLSGDERLLASTNASGYHRPFLWNPRTGERSPLSAPELSGDLTAQDWSPDGRYVVCTALEKAVFRLFLLDLERSTYQEIPHDGGSIGGAQFKDSQIVMQTSDSEHPQRVVSIDSDGSNRSVLLAGRSVPPSTPWRSIEFYGAGGDRVQAWLVTPEGTGPFPTIIHTHGGPSVVMTNLYSPPVQSWVDHGFAVLSINYHGSITFGAAFKNSINGRPGQLEVDDIEAGVKRLIADRIADPDLVFATGGSYGGYLTLLSLGRLGTLFAGGAAQVAVADWSIMYEDEADSLRGVQRALFGGSPEEKPEAHRNASPSTYVDGVTAPIFVIQGRNDTRCPSRQMEVYEKKAGEAGKSITVEWFEAGHGSLRTEDRIGQQERMLQFAVGIANERHAGS